MVATRIAQSVCFNEPEKQWAKAAKTYIKDGPKDLPKGVEAAMDDTIARMGAAGLYAIVDFHLISGGYPAWTADYAAGEQKYLYHGQFLTQWFADRYGNPASPHYAPNVIGLGLNEPPVDDGTVRNGPGNVPYLENVQRQMITWVRAYAPQWVGFVSYGWSAAAPLPGGSVRSDLVAADPHGSGFSRGRDASACKGRGRSGKGIRLLFKTDRYD